MQAFGVLFRRSPYIKSTDAYALPLGYFIFEDTCSALGSRSALIHHPYCSISRAALLHTGLLLSFRTGGIIVSSPPCFVCPSARTTTIC
jgi:hypothetical protein